MGFLQNIFGKKTCTICGGECGAMSRTKIQNKEFVCDTCKRECSQYILLYKLNKEQVQAHMELMKRQQKLYDEVFSKGQHGNYPTFISKTGITSVKELGMFQLVDKTVKKNNAELFRYDQLVGYEPYQKTESNNGKEVVKEIGVKLTFASSAPGMGNTEIKPGFRVHPFIEKPIEFCIAKNSEKEIKAAESTVRQICQHFDFINGVHDNETALFSFGPSKEQKRQMAAGVEMLKGMGSMVKAAKASKDGDESAMEAAKEQIEKTSNAIDDAASHGMAVHSRAADEAEKQAWGE